MGMKQNSPPRLLQVQEIASPACVVCGCTEYTPCVTGNGPCAWAALNREGDYGLCTACLAMPLEEMLPRALPVLRGPVLKEASHVIAP
jgi:hypothetical protein